MPLIDPPEEPMDAEKIKSALERLANELPVIAVGLWALLRVVGFDVDEGTAAGIVTGVESVVTVAIALLVRRNTDGPVTALKGQRAPSGAPTFDFAESQTATPPFDPQFYEKMVSDGRPPDVALRKAQAAYQRGKNEGES